MANHISVLKGKIPRKIVGPKQNNGLCRSWYNLLYEQYKETLKMDSVALQILRLTSYVVGMREQRMSKRTTDEVAVNARNILGCRNCKIAQNTGMKHKGK